MADVLDKILEIIKNEQCEIEYNKIQQLLDKKEGLYYREIFLVLLELSKTKKLNYLLF